MYAIVDIETTGNGLKGNKITEISIFRHDGNEIIDEYTSLVNPQTEIPYYITSLTGIDTSMVKNAPLLSVIAPRILSMTQNAVFVAHSVHFDYNIIKHELQEIGIDFQRKKLCTVRLSRKLFPGFKSYSLGKLCTALQIPLYDRHRAKGDAQATVLLFEKLLKQKDASNVFNNFLNARSQEATLPPLLSKLVIDKLPDAPGIYYFKNEKSTIIYVGKAKNIKKRVLSHFYDRSEKEILMCREVADIDFELSGSELVALLMESAAIKQHFPHFNKAQKRRVKRYGIFTYEDRKGINHIAFNTLKNIPNPIMMFYNLNDCRIFIEKLCADFQLCPKYCHLQENVVSCSHFAIKSCLGICKDEETVNSYNDRVAIALQSINANNVDYIIKETGRNPDENAVVQVKNGIYLGYGFIEKTVVINSENDLEAFIKPQKDTIDIKRILNSYCMKPVNSGKVIFSENTIYETKS